jgi:hypothetical protein
MAKFGRFIYQGKPFGLPRKIDKFNLLFGAARVTKPMEKL